MRFHLALFALLSASATHLSEAWSEPAGKQARAGQSYSAIEVAFARRDMKLAKRLMRRGAARPELKYTRMATPAERIAARRGPGMTWPKKLRPRLEYRQLLGWF